MSAPFPGTPPSEARQVLQNLLQGVGLPPALAGAVALTGRDPVLPSSFAVGTAAQSSIAAVATAAADLWALRGGRRQDIAVDMEHAALEFRSESYFSTDGNPPGRVWDPIAGTYRCGDGRWVRIHTNFAHHRDGVLALLDCANDRESVQAALEHWGAADFEEAAAARGLVATMMRTPEEWLATPQGAALADQPLVEVERIGDALAQPLGAAARPLGGLKVLDLTRIVAGPVGCKALAAHGAQVMRIASPKLPFIPAAVKDYGRGKLSAFADLETRDGRAALTELAKRADVFVQAYRPGAIAAHGFGPEDLAALRPGIVYVSLCAYGYAGPWAGRRGFDSLVQTASGINHAEAAAAGSTQPKALPCQALDHASGYLMALGAIAGLKRRAEEGGSWHVRVSLGRTGRWLQSLGRVTGGLDCPDPAPGDDLFEESESGFGRLRAIRHAAQLSETPAHWERPSVPLGSHPPRWPS